MSASLRLGLPAWAFAGWRDRWLPASPSPLAGYAQVFNCVEGNTVFYALPSEKTVQGWVNALRGRDFRLSFKLPREITHDRDLAASLPREVALRDGQVIGDQHRGWTT